ncbi:MAG: phosphoribosylglycinamide formyltransferase [Acidobacteriota bacterium]
MSRRLGILLSGRGSNFVAIADAIAAGKLDANIAVVISNRDDAPGLEIARQRGFAAIALPSQGITRDVFDTCVAAELDLHRVDLVCLAGYLRVLSPAFIARFPQRILNIHPSLLPAFPGLHSQAQALTYGVRYAGCTVHFVDEGLDSGPIIQQAVVPVLDGDTEDTLSARILKEEHRIYSAAIGRVLTGNLRIDGRRVVESIPD